MFGARIRHGAFIDKLLDILEVASHAIIEELLGVLEQKSTNENWKSDYILAARVAPLYESLRPTYERTAP
jgi:hypothetical protein